MRIVYFDCFSGAAGDMIVGALLDAGADADALQSQLRTLPLSGYTISVGKVKKQGLAATRFEVALDSSRTQPHRHLCDVVEVIRKAQVSQRVKSAAERVFTRLAEAEAKVHGTTPDNVHFHEVGAVDAIVDVVGACVGLDLLGIERVACSAIPVGSGTIRCEHGELPVPGPATARLLEGIPLAACEETGELITPTGAAILTSLAESFGTLPSMTLRQTGYGAGSREGKSRPNVLRVLVGEGGMGPWQGGLEPVCVLETAIDDATPQVMSYCIERLLSAGALDAYTVPIQMKKGRLGYLLTVLCRPEHGDELEAVVFAETPTLGVRRELISRRILPRRVERVMTRFGEIGVKVGGVGVNRKAAAEFEDCRRAAQLFGVAISEVMQEALMEWRKGIGR